MGSKAVDDPTERGTERGTEGASEARARDARGANDDVAVRPGTAETKWTGRRTGTTERAGENGDGDDDDVGGGGCDSQRRCARGPRLFRTLLFWGCARARARVRIARSLRDG